MGLSGLGVVTVAVGRQLHLGAASSRAQVVMRWMVRRAAATTMRSGATPAARPARRAGRCRRVGVARGIGPAAARKVGGAWATGIAVGESRAGTPSASGPPCTPGRMAGDATMRQPPINCYQNKGATIADGIKRQNHFLPISRSALRAAARRMPARVQRCIPVWPAATPARGHGGRGPAAVGRWVLRRQRGRASCHAVPPGSSAVMRAGSQESTSSARAAHCPLPSSARPDCRGGPGIAVLAKH